MITTIEWLEHWPSSLDSMESDYPRFIDAIKADAIRHAAELVKKLKPDKGFSHVTQAQIYHKLRDELRLMEAFEELKELPENL